MQHDPDICHVCQRHSLGVGFAHRDGNRWLCKECIEIVEYVRSARRLDAYELRALDGGVDAVGAFIESIDGKTDLADYDENEQRMLVKAAWLGCGKEMRRLLKEEAPF